MGFEPPRQLYGADIVALAVVGAALRDENRVAVAQVLDRRSALDCGLEKSLVPRHQYRERGQRHVVGNDVFDLAENLTVGNDERGLFAESGKCFGKLRVARYYRRRARIEQVADSLLLRQNQPALGSRLVNRNDEDGKLSCAD